MLGNIIKFVGLFGLSAGLSVFISQVVPMGYTIPIMVALIAASCSKYFWDKQEAAPAIISSVIFASSIFSLVTFF